MPFSDEEVIQMHDAGMKPEDIASAEKDFETKSQPSLMDNPRVQGAIGGAVPGVSTVKSFMNPDASGTDRLGAASGDLLNAGLMLGSGGLSGVAKQAALGATGGALQPELQSLSEKGSDMGGQVAKKFSPLSYIPEAIKPGPMQMPLEILRNLPEAGGQIAGSFLPQLALMVLGKGMKASAPGEPNVAGRALADNGGQPTAAMLSGPGIKQGILSLLEKSARTNPLLEGKYQDIDSANAGAIGNMARNKFGTDVMDNQAPLATGQTISDLADKVAGRRSQAYQPAAEAISNAKGNFAKGLTDAVTSVKGTENISNSSYNAFMRALNTELAGMKNAAQVDKALTGVKEAFRRELGDQALSGQTSRDFKTMMGAINDAFAEKMGDSGDVVREAKRGYANDTSAMAPIMEVLNNRDNAPEQIGKSTLNAGSQALSDFQGKLQPNELAGFQKAMARSVLEDAKGQDGLSTAKLGTAMNKPNVRTSGALGPQAVELADLHKTMQRAGINDLANLNRSGTAVLGSALAHMGVAGAALTEGIAHGNWTPTALAAAKALADYGYTYGGVPLSNLISKVGAGTSAMAPSGLQALSMQQAANSARRLSQVGK